MALRNLTQGCLLDPHELVHEFITVFFKEGERKSVLVVDDPDEEKAVFLD